MITERTETDRGVLAIVAGKPLTAMPNDLFIPPDALEVLLDSFSGPLDLLLYLIRRQNIDILNIPMTLITQQYMQYIHLMGKRRLELAADYLVMAALLTEIKSRLLLPSCSEQQNDDEEEDPRLVLVRQLQAYEQIKAAAEFIDTLPRYERDVFHVQLEGEIGIEKEHPDVRLIDLGDVFAALLQRQAHQEHHHIAREPLSVRERMSMVLASLQEGRLLEFRSLLILSEGRMGLVVTLLAILELSRQSLLVITQTDHFAPIYLKAAHYG